MSLTTGDTYKFPNGIIATIYGFSARDICGGPDNIAYLETNGGGSRFSMGEHALGLMGATLVKEPRRMSVIDFPAGVPFKDEKPGAQEHKWDGNVLCWNNDGKWTRVEIVDRSFLSSIAVEVLDETR